MSESEYAPIEEVKDNIAKAMEEQLRKSPVWRTKEGKEIPLAMMSKDHLFNVWRFLDRKLASILHATIAWASPIWGPRGEMAQDAALRDMEAAWKEEAVAAKWIVWVGQEIERRGLEIPERSEPKPLPKIKSVENVEVGGRCIGQIFELEPYEEDK